MKEDWCSGPFESVDEVERHVLSLNLDIWSYTQDQKDSEWRSLREQYFVVFYYMKYMIDAPYAREEVRVWKLS